ncbi:unnamed protein product, partial [Choristocarpus tenellus]
SNIRLDGVQPHIAALSFGGDSNATYAGGDTIQIFVLFTAPVVVTGSPSLLLETGTIDREAVWVNSNRTVVIFEYTVVTGDSATDLDY